MTEPMPTGPDQARRPLGAALLDLAYVLRRLAVQAKMLLEERRGRRAGGLRRSGVFVAGSSDAVTAVATRAAAAGWTVARVNGDGVTTKAAFLREMSRALNFPDYFGHNWDALADCLGDLSWDPATGYLLVLDRFDQLALAAPADWAVALTILRRATDEWRTRNRAMLVLLHGPRAAAPDVPPFVE